MNRIIAVTVSLIFILCGFTCKERQQQKNKIEKVTLHYVELEIETPFRISCENFEDFFSSSYKTVVINDSKQLNKFEDFLSHCEVLDSVKKIDVRVKALITFGNKKSSSFCMDKFNNLILDNQSINPNEDIIAFIKEQISK